MRRLQLFVAILGLSAMLPVLEAGAAPTSGEAVSVPGRFVPRGAPGGEVVPVSIVT